MFKREYLFLFLIIFLNCSNNSSISGANTGDAKQEVGQVIGYVYEKLDHVIVPVNNAKVILIETGKEYSQAYKKSIYTDTAGLYSFYKNSDDSLMPGTYNLVAEYNNKSAYIHKGLTITDTNINDSCISIELDTPQNSKTQLDISGIVNDSTELDSGFIVFLGTNQNKVYFDSSGNVNFNNFPEGIYDIEINLHTNNNSFIIDTTISIPTNDSLITISDLDYHSDSLIIENILKLNNINNVQVNSITEIIDNRIVSLNLTDLSIENLPDSLSRLDHLETLIMKYSKMQMIPVSICKLEKLKTLDLSYNQIDSIPFDFGSLKKLQNLDLSGNLPLKTLPETIGKLDNLENLQLKDCYNLINLPHSIGNLEKLRKIDCSTCLSLRVLPSGIETLINLTSLKVTHSQISTLPNEISNISSLTELILTNNKLTTLPNNLGLLMSLQSIDLSNNNLQSIPNSIGNLKSLNSLYLNNNELSTLPVEITNLTSPQFSNLSLENNYLKDITNKQIIDWANRYDPGWLLSQESR